MYPRLCSDGRAAADETPRVSGPVAWTSLVDDPWWLSDFRTELDGPVSASFAHASASSVFHQHHQHHRGGNRDATPQQHHHPQNHHRSPPSSNFFWSAASAHPPPQPLQQHSTGSAAGGGDDDDSSHGSSNAAADAPIGGGGRVVSSAHGLFRAGVLAADTHYDMFLDFVVPDTPSHRDMGVVNARYAFMHACLRMHVHAMCAYA
jgi:hypothetical protein